MSFVGADLAFAAPFAGAQKLVSAGEFLAHDPLRLEVPSQYAKLQEVHQGKNGTLLIHVQDAHSNLSGQENLANVLDQILSRHNVDLVLVEGGAGDVSLTPIKGAASADVWKKVAKSFLIEGKLSGEEYLNLASGHPMRIMGIEDESLYFESLRAYADLASHREKTLEYLARIRRSVEKIKQKLYPAELLDYEKNDNSKFENKFEALLKLAAPNGFPALEKLARLKEAEKRIDFTLANLEQAALLEEIAKRGGGGDLKTRLERARGAKNDKLSQYAHFQNTLEIAQKRNVTLLKYPTLLKYGEYLKAFTLLDLEAVLEEMERFENGVYPTFLTTQDQRLIRAVDRHLALLQTAFQIRMTTKEFGEFRANDPDFGTIPYLAFVNRKLAGLGYAEDMIAYENVVEEGKKALEAFYDSVTQRDFAFIANTEKILSGEKEKVAVLISGGYHTPHLKKLFKEKGYSYAVLTPVVTGETIQSKYERLLLAPLQNGNKTLAVQSSAWKNSDGIRRWAAAQYRVGDVATRDELVLAGARLANQGRPAKIPSLLAVAGKKKLNGLNISQAAKLIKVSQSGLSHHLRSHPEDFDTYGIEKGGQGREPVIPEKLQSAGKKKLNGLNISQAAELIGVTPSGLSHHLRSHPEDFDTYGIEKGEQGREPVIPEKFQSAGKKKLNGLNISQAAELIGVTPSGLTYHLQSHPEDFKRYGIEVPTNIPSLLESTGGGKLEGKNMSEAARILGVSPRGLFYHLQSHPEDFDTYGIEKGEPIIPARLHSFGKKKLNGLNISQAADLIGVSGTGLSLHLQSYPEDFKRYGIVKGGAPKKSSGARLAEDTPTVTFKKIQEDSAKLTKSYLGFLQQIGVVNQMLSVHPTPLNKQDLELLRTRLNEFKASLEKEKNHYNDIHKRFVGSIAAALELAEDILHRFGRVGCVMAAVDFTELNKIGQTYNIPGFGDTVRDILSERLEGIVLESTPELSYDKQQAVAPYGSNIFVVNVPIPTKDPSDPEKEDRELNELARRLVQVKDEVLEDLLAIIQAPGAAAEVAEKYKRPDLRDMIENLGRFLKDPPAGGAPQARQSLIERVKKLEFNFAHGIIQLPDRGAYLVEGWDKKDEAGRPSNKGLHDVVEGVFSRESWELVRNFDFRHVEGVIAPEGIEFLKHFIMNHAEFQNYSAEDLMNIDNWAAPQRRSDYRELLDVFFIMRRLYLQTSLADLRRRNRDAEELRNESQIAELRGPTSALFQPLLEDLKIKLEEKIQELILLKRSVEVSDLYETLYRMLREATLTAEGMLFYTDKAARIKIKNRIKELIERGVTEEERRLGHELLALHYGLLQKARMNARPLYFFREGRLPRPIHVFGQLLTAAKIFEGRGVGPLEKAVERLGTALEKNDFKNEGPYFRRVAEFFRIQFVEYRSRWYRAFAYAYADPRLYEVIQEGFMHEILEADANGKLREILRDIRLLRRTDPSRALPAANQLLTKRTKRLKEVEDALTPGLIVARGPQRDDIRIAVADDEGNHHLFLVELNHFGDVQRVYPPDRRDSVIHEILLGLRDAARRYTRQSDMRGLPEELVQVVERVAAEHGLGPVPKTEKVPLRGKPSDPVERMPVYLMPEHGDGVYAVSSRDQVLIQYNLTGPFELYEFMEEDRAAEKEFARDIQKKGKRLKTRLGAVAVYGIVLVKGEIDEWRKARDWFNLLDNGTADAKRRSEVAEKEGRPKKAFHISELDMEHLSGARLAATGPSFASPAVREPTGSRLAATGHSSEFTHLSQEEKKLIFILTRGLADNEEGLRTARRLWGGGSESALQEGEFTAETVRSFREAYEDGGAKLWMTQTDLVTDLKLENVMDDRRAARLNALLQKFDRMATLDLLAQTTVVELAKKGADHIAETVNRLIDDKNNLLIPKGKESLYALAVIDLLEKEGLQEKIGAVIRMNAGRQPEDTWKVSAVDPHFQDLFKPSLDKVEAILAERKHFDSSLDALLVEGKHNEALKLAERLKWLYAKDAPSYVPYKIGKIYEALGDRGKAVRSYREAIRHPDLRSDAYFEAFIRFYRLSHGQVWYKGAASRAVKWTVRRFRRILDQFGLLQHVDPETIALREARAALRAVLKNARRNIGADRANTRGITDERITVSELGAVTNFTKRLARRGYPQEGLAGGYGFSQAGIESVEEFWRYLDRNGVDPEAKVMLETAVLYYLLYGGKYTGPEAEKRGKIWSDAVRVAGEAVSFWLYDPATDLYFSRALAAKLTEPQIERVLELIKKANDRAERDLVKALNLPAARTLQFFFTWRQRAAERERILKAALNARWDADLGFGPSPASRDTSGSRLAATRPSFASPAVREPTGSRLAASPEEIENDIAELERKITPPVVVFDGKHVEVVQGALRVFPVPDVHADLKALIFYFMKTGLLKGKASEVREITPELIQKIWSEPGAYFDLRKGDVVVFTGDYVDTHLFPRHPGLSTAREFLFGSLMPNVDTLRFVQEMKRIAQKNEARVITLMGNHDHLVKQLFHDLDAIVKPSKDVAKERAVQLAQQEERHSHLFEDLLKTVDELFDAYYKPDGSGQWIRDFFDGLKFVAAVDNNVFIHAGMIQMNGLDDLEKVDAAIEEKMQSLTPLTVWQETTYASVWMSDESHMIPRLTKNGLGYSPMEKLARNARENRLVFYDLVRNALGWDKREKPDRVFKTFVGHDTSAKAVIRGSTAAGERSLEENNDVIRADGGMNYYYRVRSRPGLAVLRAVEGGMFVLEADRVRNIARMDESAGDILDSGNAATARQAAHLRTLLQAARKSGEEKVLFESAMAYAKKPAAIAKGFETDIQKELYGKSGEEIREEMTARYKDKFYGLAKTLLNQTETEIGKGQAITLPELQEAVEAKKKPWQLRYEMALKNHETLPYELEPIEEYHDLAVRLAASRKSGARLAERQAGGRREAGRGREKERKKTGLSQTLIDRVEDADPETLILIARSLLDLKKISRTLPFNFKLGNALITAEMDEKRETGWVYFYAVGADGGPQGRPFTKVRLTETIVKEAKALKDSQSALRVRLAERSEALEAFADDQKAAGTARQFYHQLRKSKAPDVQFNNERTVVLRFTTEKKLRPEKSGLYRSQLQTIHSIAGNKVLVQFAQIRRNGKSVLYGPSDPTPPKGEDHALFHLSELSEKALKAAGAQGAGFASVPGLSDDETLIPFVAQGVFLTAIGRLSGYTDSIQQLWRNVRGADASQNLDPESFGDIRRVRKADLRRYARLQFRTIGRIAWEKVLEYARLVLQAVGTAA